MRKFAGNKIARRRIGKLVSSAAVSAYAILLNGVPITLSGVPITLVPVSETPVGSQSAPVLTIDAPVTNPPTFSAVMDSPVVNDIIRLQVSASLAFSTLSQNVTNTLDLAEVAAGDASLGVTSMASGAWYARARHERDGTASLWSNIITFAI